ncbi:MAG: ferrous iron transporter B, partial [Planctomycetia bacterium]|nr:ferrous iron transporter B [Planctomycetia bacterium]
NQLVQSIDRATTTRIRPQTYHLSDRIDAWVCHPLWGPLVLFALMVLIFQVTFNLADGWHWFPSISFSPLSFSWTTPVEWINGIFHSWIPEHVERLLHMTDPASISFLRHGILAGVGGVVQFLPIIFIMFTILAMLEQSGYIARVAMIMDSFMRRFGLQGRSILPLVLGGGISGGCAVPAILTTRSITNFRQRTLTILAIPMLNFGGKVPVFAMLVAAFFSAWQGLVMAGIVFFSWAMALCSAWIFGHTVLKGKELPLLLELPSYQIPSMWEVFASSSRQSIEFLKKAGTVILGTNMFLWCLMSWPGTNPKSEDLPPGSPNPPTEAMKADWRLEHSYAAQIGRLLEPVSQYAGFSWKDNVALIGGIAAKELIVSSMITMYLVDENSSATQTENAASDSNPDEQEKKGMQLRSVLSNSPEWSRAKAFAMLVFIMFFAPCSGTLVAIYRVTGSLKWPFISFVYNTAIAFILAVALFQIFGRFQ